jgi:hypothetical protein
MMILASSALPQGAAAQSAGPEWSDPLNLSRSGGAENPRLVVTPNGTQLVFWDDAYTASALRGGMGGFATGAEGSWGAPTRVEFPFAGRPTRLLAGSGNLIHAFWIDAAGSLRHGAASLTSLGAGGSWGGQVIASSVTAFDVAVDPSGRFQVVCLIAAEGASTPAGIYTLRSGLRGDTWSAPSPIYRSDYFRAFLPAGEGRPSSPSESPVVPGVEIEVSHEEGSQLVYMAWDNPALKRIYLAISQDGGGTWGEPVELEGPDAESPYSTPHDVAVSAEADQVLLLWQDSEEGGSCTQFYQTSDDQGVTWSDPTPVLGQQSGCLDGIQVLGRVGDNTLVFAGLQGRALLLAWNGSDWSLPHTEAGLDVFTNPETFGFVELGCRQAALSGDRLVVVGCGIEDGGTDVWQTERPLDEVNAWFDPTQGWAEIGHVAIASDPMLSFDAAGDGTGQVIALWSTPHSDLAEGASSDLVYAGLDHGQLVGPFAVLTRQVGLAKQVHLFVDGEGRLLAVWSGGNSGELSFSWASVPEAGSEAGWFAPDAVPAPTTLGDSPHLLETSSGSLVLAYAVAFNESRGVYVATAEASTLEWGPPVRVFDAATAGCAKVEQTSLTGGTDGTLHLAWVCASLPGGIGPMAIYHARSSDGGLTWSEPALVLERRAAWSQIAVDRRGSLHLVWEERLGDRIYTWDAISRTGGQDWEEPLSISVVDAKASFSSMSSDSSGRFHLLQAVQEGHNPPVLHYSEWDGSAWMARDDLTLAVRNIADLEGLASTVDQANGLVAIYAGVAPRDSSGVAENELHFAAIPLPPAPAEESTSTDATAVPPAVAASAATPAEGEPATAAAPVLGPEEAARPSSGGPIGIVVGGATALLLVVGLIVARLRSPRPASPDSQNQD